MAVIEYTGCLLLIISFLFNIYFENPPLVLFLSSNINLSPFRKVLKVNVFKQIVPVLPIIFFMDLKKIS